MAAEPKYRVEEWTEEVNEDSKQHHWENCPHGCEDGDCEGHYEDADRLFGVTNIFDRTDGDGAGYFSEGRAKLLAAFLEEENDGQS